MIFTRTVSTLHLQRRSGFRPPRWRCVLRCAPHEGPVASAPLIGRFEKARQEERPAEQDRVALFNDPLKVSPVLSQCVAHAEKAAPPPKPFVFGHACATTPGLMIVGPQPSKSLVLWVATAAPMAAAMAAIWQSASAIGRPAARRLATMRA